MISNTMRRGLRAVLLATVVAVSVPSVAGAAGVGWGAFGCSGDVRWQVDPVGGTASAAFKTGGSCLTAWAEANDTGRTDLGTVPGGTGAWTVVFPFTPVVNATAPTGAFSGTVSYSGNGWTGIGNLNGVNGAFTGEIVWSNGTDAGVELHTGVTSCGTGCFDARYVFAYDPLRSI